MTTNAISRIDFMNPKKKTDFEILDLQLFFSIRPHKKLESDFRLNFWVMLYITEGSGYHYIDFQKYAYKKGDVIFIQKNQVHRFKINDSVKGYVLHINEPFFYLLEGINGDLVFMAFADEVYGSPVLAFDIAPGTTNRALVDLIYKEYNRPAEHLNIELIASLFQGFILSLKRQIKKDQGVLQSKDYENFKAYRKLVEAHYTETRNVEDYAAMMHLSKKTVNQATRQVVDLSAKQFIINRLILEIKRYLSQGELMNYEIADALGFGEAANMTKFFKRYEGISPKDFKGMMLQETNLK